MRARFLIIPVLLAAAFALPAVAQAAAGFSYPEAPAPAVAPQSAPKPQPQTTIQQHETASRFGLVAPTYIPPGVSKTGIYTTPLPKGVATPTAQYDLNWTIGTAGKSGCMVCHGDPNLVKIANGQVQSLYVSTEVLQDSAHKDVLCTECHLDFAYNTPHPNTVVAGDEWKNIAKSSCKNCHRPQFTEYANGAHSPAARPGETSTVGAPDSSAPGKPRPLCGDCHGGHAIPSKTDTAAAGVIHDSALSMCGGCHEEWASSYQDYYHGAAYRRGANDAPACWQCHNTHQILASADRNSWTNKNNLPRTCGQCHKGAAAGYLDYASFIHRRTATLQENPVIAVTNRVKQAVGNVIYQVSQVFGRNGS